MTDQPRVTRDEFLRIGALGGISLGMGGLLQACGGDGGGSADSQGGSPASGGKPTRGGTLKVGVSSGSAETFNPWSAEQEIDICRSASLYDRLAHYDQTGKPYLTLAEELTPSKGGTVWTVKLKQGVEFHNGKELTADDAVYSWRTMVKGGKEAVFAGNAIPKGFIKPENITKVDKYTLRFQLDKPIGGFIDNLADRTAAIVPDGFKDFGNPVGTGAFKFKSFTPNQNSVFVRQDNWWGGNNQPYADELQIFAISDPNARMNALLGGQINVMATVSISQISTLKSRGMTILNSDRTDNFTPLIMATQRKPFDNLQVRQAFKLIADRKQMVDNVLRGYGVIGNDLSCPLDPMYAKDIPQRERDVEKAKALLKQAGAEGLSVDLYTSDLAPGMLEGATLFAQQAKDAGVNVNLKKVDSSTYYDGPYQKVPFFQDTFLFRSMPSWYVLFMSSQGTFNDTQWEVPSFDKLIDQGFAEVDEAKRKEIWHEIQQINYDEGGWINWGFYNNVDATAPKVRGIPLGIRNLNFYHFEEAYIAA
jgi:peptide/nickel transport system substrate-binding protein